MFFCPKCGLQVGLNESCGCEIITWTSSGTLEKKVVRGCTCPDNARCGWYYDGGCNSD